MKRNHFIVEMHNLSISCAVVCVILLGAAAILGLFGILRRELSAVLVTGVMYILAGRQLLLNNTHTHLCVYSNNGLLLSHVRKCQPCLPSSPL